MVAFGLLLGLGIALAIPRRMEGPRLFILLMLLCASAVALHHPAAGLAAAGGAPLSLAAVTVALVNGPGSTGFPSQNYQEWTVIATADGDTVTGAITHAMGIAFARAFMKWLAATAALSLWVFTTYPTGTTWQATKATTAGSGGAAVQLRVELMRAA